MFGPKRSEVTGEWRRLHEEELHTLCFPPNIQVTNPRRMRWAGHIARMGERRGANSGWWQNLREGGYLEDPNINVKIISKWMFKRWDGRVD